MKRFLLVAIILLSSLTSLLSIRSVSAETVTFGPTQDAFVNSSAPDKNYGISGTLQLVDGPDTDIRSFIEFSVADLPGPITGAVLRLHVNEPGTTPTDFSLASSGWAESAVTWNTQPALIAGLGSGGQGVAAGAWVEFDVTSAVTGNGVYDFGLATSGADQTDYLSKDSTQVAKRPQLVITYETVTPPTAIPTTEPTETLPESPTETDTPGSTSTAVPTARATRTPTAVTTRTPTKTPVPTSTSTLPPALSLSASSGHVYDTLRIHARRFKPNTSVAIFFDASRMLTVTIGSDGSARGSFVVPRAPAGAHRIRAAGGGQEAFANFQIQPLLSLSTTTVKAGDPVTVTLRGFGASATVAVRLYASSSTGGYVTLGSIATSSTGTGQATFIVRADTRSGPYTVTATHTSSTDDAALTVAAAAQDFTFSAVGDLMTSTSVGGAGYTRADKACSLAGQEALVLALGDLQYQNGSYSLFMSRYDVSACGDIKDKTRPVPGNHEYDTVGAAGYYQYFGARAGDPAKGYYSFDQGGVHFIAVNSNCTLIKGGCGSTGAQYQFIKQDLEANSESCSVMYFHHPRYGSGEHGNNSNMDPIWDLFAANNGDIVLGGHDHNYERFAPMDAAGKADAGGVRQFVVGTGGVSFYGFGATQPNSQVRMTNITGVLKVTVSGTTYTWRLISIDGATLDTGSGTCQ